MKRTPFNGVAAAEVAAALLVATGLIYAASRPEAGAALIGGTVTYCALVAFSLVSLLIQRLKP